jgi:hypothetical protein
MDCADPNFKMRVFDPNEHKGNRWAKAWARTFGRLSRPQQCPTIPASCADAALGIRPSAAADHAIPPRKPSASTESALASCLAVSGAGSGIFRLCAPVAGSRSIHGCAGALGLLAAARAEPVGSWRRLPEGSNAMTKVITFRSPSCPAWRRRGELWTPASGQELLFQSVRMRRVLHYGRYRNRPRRV